MTPAGLFDDMRSFDELYPQDNGQSQEQQFQTQFAIPLPYDLKEIELDDYRDLDPELTDYEKLQHR